MLNPFRRCAWAVASVVPLVGCESGRTPGSGGATTSQFTPAATQLPSVAGVRYYVDPNGSDSSPGTAAAPFKSIQGAAQVASPGDTVMVRPGVYTGADRVVTLTRSGSAAGWITFLSEQKWKAVIDGRNGASLEGWYFGRDVGYVRIEGFEIRNLYEHAFDTYGGRVHDLMIVRNRVHHIGRNCTDTRNGRTGASLGAETRRVIFDGNVWYDIGRFAPGEHGCSPKTEYYQNHDHGIYVADADEIVIINNVFQDFRRGWAIHRYHSGGWVTRGLLIANNTFVGENPYRPGQIILATPTAGLRIENNIFHGPQSAALFFESSRFPGATVRYNMVFGGSLKLGPAGGVSLSHNWERDDPRFVSDSVFRLASGSPAIDAGVSLREVLYDADGVPRPRGGSYDLGAYER